jgi:hypothetical protein
MPWRERGRISDFEALNSFKKHAESDGEKFLRGLARTAFQHPLSKREGV